MTNNRKTHTYEMLDGTTVEYVIGRNARENSQLVQEAMSSDIWFHAGDGISSCHVIAELPENHNFTERELLNIVKVGAGLCKQNTNKLKDQCQVPIIYTTVDNVKTTKVYGEVKLKTNPKTIYT
jgi:predicted ribosome quality control (RQC) complex YloA/Tae2 family protein